MKRASKDEVRQAAETLIAPVLEGFLTTVSGVDRRLLELRKDLENTVQRLNREADELNTERMNLSLERANTVRSVQQFRAQTKVDQDEVIRTLQDFSGELRSRMVQAEMKAAKAVEAAAAADTAKKLAQRAEMQAKVARADTDNLLLSMRESAEKAQRAIRLESKVGVSAVRVAVSKQEARLQSFADRSGEQLDSVVEHADKTLRKASALVQG